MKEKASCHQDREANVKIVAPGARVELAWISPNDFEFFSNLASHHNFILADGSELPNLSMVA